MPTRADAATAGNSPVVAMAGCGAAGYGIGSLFGAAVLLGLAGLFAGIVGGMVLVNARSKRL